MSHPNRIPEDAQNVVLALHRIASKLEGDNMPAIAELLTLEKTALESLYAGLLTNGETSDTRKALNSIITAKIIAIEAIARRAGAAQRSA